MCGNYSREETIQGRKLYEEIRQQGSIYIFWPEQPMRPKFGEFGLNWLWLLVGKSQIAPRIQFLLFEGKFLQMCIGVVQHCYFYILCITQNIILKLLMQKLDIQGRKIIQEIQGHAEYFLQKVNISKNFNLLLALHQIRF